MATRCAFENKVRKVSACVELHMPGFPCSRLELPQNVSPEAHFTRERLRIQPYTLPLWWSTDTRSAELRLECGEGFACKP